jgi:DNA-binding transcriptional ArsR family regulator
MHTFKALASDTRLDILKALDGKRMNLKELGSITNLNKATLHEHLAKLNEAGLIKRKEREGHKWVYYKLTWKGEGLLHPENTRIVVMFSLSFISLLVAFILMINFLQPIALGMAETVGDTTYLYEAENEGFPLLKRSYSYKYLGEIDAKGKTVGNITEELQQRASPKNSIGTNYDDEDIIWRAVETYLSMEENAPPKPCVMDNIYSSSDEYIPTDQNIVHPCNYTNQSFNNTYDNETNKTTIMLDGGSLIAYLPVVPEMIATVQDITLLYFAIFCLVFFGASFTLSTWRLLSNKKTKL